MRGTETLDFAVTNVELRHAQGIYDVIRTANGEPLDQYSHCINPEAVAEQLERFPQGQFVAITYEDGHEKVIGMGTTMRTHRSPYENPLPWYDQIGSFGLRNHDPEGDWLYGVEIAVDPNYQKRGVASALYKARLGLVNELNLKGWYAGGMLIGYDRYRNELTPREYGEKVINGEITDPTVTMQLHRGLKGAAVIEGYYPEWLAGDAAVLLVYDVADQQTRRKRPARTGLRELRAAPTR